MNISFIKNLVYRGRRERKLLALSSRLVRVLLIFLLVLLNFSIYHWTVREPFMGDALMHLVDDTQIHSTKDVLRAFYMAKNPDYNEENRITSMHRPVFNEILITVQKQILDGDFSKLRYISLLIHIINGVLFYCLIILLRQSDIRAFFASLFFSLNPVYFYSQYEFGLSFSL